MVRLRLGAYLDFLGTVAAFQFLYGTIKTLQRFAYRYAGFLFQFLYGTIKTAIYSFARVLDSVFQFLYGTIKTPLQPA